MGDVTELLAASKGGDAVAAQALFTRVYDELKLLARRQLAPHAVVTLNTTGLVHEAYLKLARPEVLGLDSRHHFFALAAKAMRQIVIDRARARVADKRGGADVQIMDIDQASGVADGTLPAAELLRLDLALTQLERDEPRLANVVELRFFAGLEMEEIATLQGLSERTIHRDWRRAKAHLYQALHPDA